MPSAGLIFNYFIYIMHTCNTKPNILYPYVIGFEKDPRTWYIPLAGLVWH